MVEQFSLEDSEEFIQLQNAWKGVKTRLQQEVVASWFEKYFRTLVAQSIADRIVTISSPSDFVKRWIEQNFLNRIGALVSDELGYSVEVVIQVLPQARKAIRSGMTEEHRVTSAGVNSVAVESSESGMRFIPDKMQTFASFVEGQSNRMAVAGAKAIIDNPGADMNPLFIYGPNGVGKTHLLNAIAGELLKRNANAEIGFVTGQQFGEDFVKAIQNRKVGAFRQCHRRNSVWLIDDIQYLAGREKTCEELFHTYNYLKSMGSQIVICSDRSPRNFHNMDERIRTRFEWGLVVDVNVPDTETRCAILLSKAQQRRIDLDHSVAMLLAERISTNIRTLEGALNSLHISAMAEGCPISSQFAVQFLNRHFALRQQSRPNARIVIDAVSRYFHIEPGEIRGASRRGPIVYARHMAIYLTREITEDTWKHIGSLFGNRDHSSVMHAYQKVEDLLKANESTQSDASTLMSRICPDKLSSYGWNVGTDQGYSSLNQ